MAYTFSKQTNKECYWHLTLAGKLLTLITFLRGGGRLPLLFLHLNSSLKYRNDTGEVFLPYLHGRKSFTCYICVNLLKMPAVVGSVKKLATLGSGLILNRSPQK